MEAGGRRAEASRRLHLGQRDVALVKHPSHPLDGLPLFVELDESRARHLFGGLSQLQRSLRSGFYRLLLPGGGFCGIPVWQQRLRLKLTLWTAGDGGADAG